MKEFYWLFATPLLASPECCSSEQDLYDEANHLLTVHNKKGHVNFVKTERINDEKHFDYRLVIEN